MKRAFRPRFALSRGWFGFRSRWSLPGCKRPRRALKPKAKRSEPGKFYRAKRAPAGGKPSGFSLRTNVRTLDPVSRSRAGFKSSLPLVAYRVANKAKRSEP